MNNLNLALTLTADGKQLVTTVNGSKKVISDLNTKLGKTGTQGRVASQGLAQVETQGKKTNNTLRNVGLTAAGAFAGLSAINLGQKITQDLAAFQDIRTRLTTLSGSTAAYAKNEEYLIGLTAKHHKELIPLADSYSKLLNLQDAGLVTQAQARKILEGMSNAQSSLGATTNQLGQSMYGLSQALASPIVRAEELNQLVEPLPGLLNKMDKAAGLPAGGFRKMVIDGKVTSDFLRNNLIIALQEFDGAAAATAANISAQTRDMNSAYQKLIVAFEAPINDSLTPVLSSVTKGLTWATENSELLQTALGTALVLALTRAGVATANYTAQLVTKVMQERAATAATITEAKAEIHRATVMRTSAITSSQAVAADARLTVARNTLTAATHRANIAGRALNGVMALAGGPAGLFLLGATALTAFAVSANKASIEVSDLDDEVDALLGRVGKMKERKLELGIDKQKASLADLENLYKEIAYAPTRQYSILEKLTSSTEEQRDAERRASKERSAQLAVLSQRIIKAKTDLELLNKALDGSQNKNKKGSSSTDSQVSKAQQKLLDQYTKQKALLKDTSEAAKIRYEIEHGSLKALDPVLNAKILAAAKDVDLTKKAAAAGKQNADAVKAQEKELKALLAVIDPMTAAANEMAEKEKLLKAYFEQANVPLEKRKQLLASLKDEYTEPSQFDNLQGQLDPTFSENQQHNENMGILGDELAITPEDEIIKRAEINMLLEAEQMRHAEAMNQINGDMTLNFDQMWEQSVDRFSAGIGSVTANALFEAQSFGKGVQQLLKGVGKAAVQMLVEWGVQKLLSAALEKGIAKTGAASAGGLMTATAAAQSTLAGINAFASTAAIPIVGPGLAPAAMSAALGITIPMASSVAGLAASMVGVAHDGIDTVPQDGTWLLQKGERVVDKRTNADLKRALYSGDIKDQKQGGVNLQQQNTIVVRNSAEADSLEEVLPQLVEMTKQAVAEDFNDRGEVWQASS